MWNFGGGQLFSLKGSALGQSPLLPETCLGAVSGPSNPDGQCIGGSRSGKREARTTFTQSMVPYTTGTVAGVDYNALRVMAKEKKQTPMVGLRRSSSD